MFFPTRTAALAGILVLIGGAAATAARAQSFVNNLLISGSATDRAPGTTPNQNRLGGFLSDLYYDRLNDVYYGLTDRGPGGGVVSYETRVQKFSLATDSTTGAISNFQLLDTIKFSDQSGAAFNGLNPLLLNNSASTLGNSFDPEGFAVGKNGNFYVSDEYGPSVSEFTPGGTLVRTFTPPANLVPQGAGGPDFVNGRPTITSGRQDNRGFEGLAVSPDGTKLYALLQDPLVNEGAQNDGRRSRNLRIVEFDTQTGASGRQFVYQLEDIAAINGRIPGTADDFSTTNQGRSIGISSLIPVNDHEFLVIERDNRGLGVDDPLGVNPVGSKRVFRIDIAGATDVSGISLANTNALPAGVTAVAKSLYLDVQAALLAAGLPLTEKLEGITIGRQLAGGEFSLLLGTDNDFSVTQTGAGEQFDVYTNGTTVRYTPLGDPARSFAAPDASGANLGALPTGFSLLPTYLYAFRAPVAGFVPQQQTIPEPGTLALAGAGGLGLFCGGARRRRRFRKNAHS